MKVSGNAFGFTKFCFMTLSQHQKELIGSQDNAVYFETLFHYLITIRFSGREGIFKATTKIT